MKIKVCGMREKENIQELVALKPDYIGFIFYQLSKRYAGDLAKEIAIAFPAGIKKTGVFVDADTEEIKNRIKDYHLDAVQLHGSESAEMCRTLKEEKVEVIKAFGIDEVFDFSKLESYADQVDYFLFDTKTTQHGGSGEVFNWDILKRYTLDKPYFLSGGISPENLPEVIKLDDRRLYAADLNSQFETEPGLKDIAKIKEAISIIR